MPLGKLLVYELIKINKIMMSFQGSVNLAGKPYGINVCLDFNRGMIMKGRKQSKDGTIHLCVTMPTILRQP